MTFSEVLEDIKQLVGLRLNSIKEGAEITIKEVNVEDNRLVLTNSNGKKKSRPIGELEQIWERLCKDPAVHVDEVLQGSGSSRNQPETILANLPYIEWFRYNNKKHIAYVGQRSHAFGTLKQMDQIQADEIRQRMNVTEDQNMPLILVVTNDIAKACKTIEQVTGVAVKPERPGIYIHDNNLFRIMLVANNLVPPEINPGTYPVIVSKSSYQPSKDFQVGDLNLKVISTAGMQLMING